MKFKSFYVDSGFFGQGGGGGVTLNISRTVSYDITLVRLTVRH